MSFLNYTPHEVNVFTPLGLEFSFPSKGIARVAESQQIVDRSHSIEFRETIYGEIEGLPEPVDGTFIIVSLLVKQVNARSENPRKDLVSPDTGATCIRENGQIKAVRAFLI